MICPRCKENVMDGSSFCVKCGYNFNANNNQQMSNQTNNGGVVLNNVTPNNGVVQNSTNNVSNNNFPKENKKGGKLLIILLAVILISGFLVLGYKFLTKNKDNATNGNNNDNKTEIEEVTAGFINNEDGKYAIFNYKGEQVTNFIYNRVDVLGFRNGAAIVTNDEGKYIVNQVGKELTNPNEYSSIDLSGVLYDASNGNSGYYLNNKGKKLYNKDEYELIPELYLFLNFSLIRNKNTKDISFINTNGDKVFTIPYKEGAKDFTYVFSTGHEYITLFYNNKSYIVDLTTNKLLQSFDSKAAFCLDDYDKTNNVLITYKCGYTEEDENKYKIFKNNKLITTNEFENKCANTHKYNRAVSFVQDKVLCGYNYDDSYIFDKDFKYLADTKDYDYMLSLKDYIKDDKLYKNGKEVKTLSCLKSAIKSKYSAEGVYRLVNAYCSGSDGLTSFYDLDGNKIGNNSYQYIGNFDGNGYAMATDGKGNTFLINKTGDKVITGKYDKYNYNGDYYIVEDGRKAGIIDKTGNEVIPLEYDAVEIQKNYGTVLTQLIKYNSSAANSTYLIYDLKNNKEIYNGKYKASFMTAFYSIYDIKNKNYDYYSYYTGEKFFSAKSKY